MKRDRPFTTAYVNKLPEYLHARFGIPPAPTYNRLRAFHADAVRTIVPTPSIAAELNDKGFDHLVVCPFGVDADIFRPRADARLDLPRPIHISVARLTPEKNIEAFLSLDLPGSKIMVGDGPLESALKQRYPDVQFPGFVEGGELAQLYAASDLFVFPSRTDTFGLVLLEAMACGLSVAAYPVAGPIDIIANSGAGVLDEDLARAANAARTIPRERARIHALNFTWQRTAARFRSYLAPFSS